MVADALSRLESKETDQSEELFANTDIEDVTDFDQLQLKNIERVQRENPQEMSKYKLVSEPNGINLRRHRGRIIIPTILQGPLLRWYHSVLGHPGINNMKTTLKQFYYFTGMDKAVENHVRTCTECQKYKKTAVRAVGHLPVRESRSCTPWERMHVDCIGPWALTVQVLNPRKTVRLEICAMIMICEATLWPEIKLFHKSHPDSISTALAFDHEWLCRYPRPSAVVFDNGG